MAYTTNFLASARRHFLAAEQLNTSHRRDVAGYLYGVAAECAIKQLMRLSGMKPLKASERRSDPFYAHFQELKTLLRDNLKGRRAGELRKYAEDSSFMQNWDTDMRYAPGQDIRAAWVDQWRAQAKHVMSTI